jgi:superoxide dismutase, Cu-Zn family
MRLITITAAAALLAGGIAQGQQAKPATAELKNAQGEVVGKVRVAPVRKGEGVRITGQVKSLPPGEHGIHIHMTGKCDPPDFTSAGGHFNPTNAKHSLHTQGGHAGDLGNLTVAANGRAKIDLRIPNVTLAEGANSLLKEGGTALVIHANADDLKTDPTGNAGGRIACGVIMK